MAFKAENKIMIGIPTTKLKSHAAAQPCTHSDDVIRQKKSKDDQKT